jgi:hypothetical protein
LIYGEYRCLNAQERLIKSYAETETLIQKKYIEAKNNRDESKIDVLINMMADNSQKRDRTLLELKSSMYSMSEIVAIGVFVINFAVLSTFLRKRSKRKRVTH